MLLPQARPTKEECKADHAGVRGRPTSFLASMVIDCRCLLVS